MSKKKVLLLTPSPNESENEILNELELNLLEEECNN